MRIGITVGEMRGPVTLEDITGQVRSAAEAGFATAWSAQLFGWDALTTLAVAGPSAPGIGLGIQRFVEDMFGYSYDKPARHMREYLSALVPLLRGESVSYQGETVRAAGTVSVPTATPPPLLVAALGPVMLRTAGELADGTVTWMTGPKTLASHIVPTITKAAAAAGRPHPQVVAGLVVCVTSDEDGVRGRIAERYALAGQVPTYRAMLDREGVAGPQDVIIVGDEAAVERQVRRLAEAGATEFLAAPFGSAAEQARTADVLADLAKE